MSTLIRINFPRQNPFSFASTFSTSPSVASILKPTVSIWHIVGNPWIWTQNGDLSNLMSFTASPLSSLWRTNKYLSKDDGQRNSTLSISSFVWKRNMTLFSPRSLASKIFYVFHIVLSTLATDSRLTLPFVKNFPMRTRPSSGTGSWIITSASSLDDSFIPVHLSVISSMILLRKLTCSIACTERNILYDNPCAKDSPYFHLQCFRTYWFLVHFSFSPRLYAICLTLMVYFLTI